MNKLLQASGRLITVARSRGVADASVFKKEGLTFQLCQTGCNGHACPQAAPS